MKASFKGRAKLKAKIHILARGYLGRDLEAFVGWKLYDNWFPISLHHELKRTTVNFETSLSSSTNRTKI
jgi:hypothetical protein